MKLRSLKVEYFRGFRNKVEVQFGDGINMVIGVNGSGKSSLLNAIEWCLFGRDVEVRGTGIDERGSWEVPWRNSQKTDTLVELECESNEGSVSVCRTRKAEAKKTTPDELTVKLPDDSECSGEDAESWMQDNGFPESFQDWQSGYCHHQEAARLRLTDNSHFREAMAKLLGLEDITIFRDDLRKVRVNDYINALLESEDRINEALHGRLDNNSGLDKAKEALEAHGLDPSQVTEQLAIQDAKTIQEQAEVLKEYLQLKLKEEEWQIPKDPDDLESIGEFLVWAGKWEEAVLKSPSRLEDLPKLQKEKTLIEGKLVAVGVAQKALEDAKKALEEFWESNGGKRDLEVELKEIQERIEELKKALEALSQMAVLLDRALKQINETEEETCPVCESEVPELEKKVKRRMEKYTSEEIEKIREKIKKRKEEEKKLEGLIAGRDRLIAAIKLAQENLEKAITALREVIPNSEVEDPVAAANSRLEELEETIQELMGIFEEREKRLEWHKQAFSILKAMDEYLVELGKGDEDVDFSPTPEWEAWQKAVDELADLVVDVRDLSKHTLAIQEEMTKEREESVNQTLGKYFNLIVGPNSASQKGMRITSKRTPTRINYSVQDKDEKDLVPILNQAAMNALSLAVLFARAEARAAQGSPCVLILDDPQQSLDESHIEGLVKAFEEIVNCGIPVLVGTMPGILPERITGYAACAKHSVQLQSWSQETGARLEEATA
jgi:exonuclease SbcC